MSSSPVSAWWSDCGKNLGDVNLIEDTSVTVVSAIETASLSSSRPARLFGELKKACFCLVDALRKVGWFGGFRSL